MNNGITFLEKEGNVYYYVNWSPLAKADRYEINAKVPSVGGVFELYWMDEKKRLRLFNVGQTIFGGLRSEIRRLTDPELCMNDEKTKTILEDKEIWYRYSAVDSSNIMADVVWFFMQRYFPEKEDLRHSGRYKEVFIKESEPDKLLWVP